MEMKNPPIQGGLWKTLIFFQKKNKKILKNFFLTSGIK
eukprot:SAG31_NODE_27549_length_424_cov_0.821538_1_plen_37_part_10